MCAALVALLPLTASAQPPARSFQELLRRVEIGDLVFVVDPFGVETKGKLGAVSSGSIALTVDGTRREFVDSTVTPASTDGAETPCATGSSSALVVGRSSDFLRDEQRTHPRAHCLGSNAVRVRC